MPQSEDGRGAGTLDSPFAREASPANVRHDKPLDPGLGSVWQEAFTPAMPADLQERANEEECPTCRQPLPGELEAEGPQFEYDLASAPRDHSLRDIADSDNLPNETRAAILRDGKANTYDLTDQAFWARHPDMKGKKLERTGASHKALREEYGAMAQQVATLIWLRQLLDELDKHRGDIPREFLLGWMAVESDGKVGVVTSRPERGYFQIDWPGGEAREQLGLTEAQFRKLSMDRVFSIEKGMELVEKYRQFILKNFPQVSDRTELLWRLTKGRHAASASLSDVLQGLLKSGTAITWDNVAARVPAFLRNNVNLTWEYTTKLKPFADLPGSAAQPKLYAEPAPGFEQQATPAPPPPTKTRVSDQFAIPFRWMARVSLRKRGSEESHGSGVLISDVHVLTAAHVVWNATVSPAEYSVEVTLAQDGSNFLDRIGVSRIEIPKRYKDGGQMFDYSILTLDSPVADRTYKDLGGVRLCYWGSSTGGAGTTAKPVDPASLNGQVAITAGYPRDKSGNQMWVVTGTMSRSVGGTAAIRYTGELIEGQSGSPAWIEQNGARNIVGLVASRGTFNRLYPLSWDMVEELNGWMLRAENKPELQTESEPETGFERGSESEDSQTGYEQLDHYEEQETPRPSAAQERCRQDWGRQFDVLPEVLRQALTTKDFNNAIVIAIHHGWRDLDQLTDLIFFAEKGEQRGYCKLTNSAADAADREYWRQKRDIVRSFILHPSPPLAQHGGVPCRKVEFKLDAHHPDLRKRDLTGLYEYREYLKGLDAEVTSYVVNINQAGRHIEGLMTRVLRSGSEEKTRAQYRVYGDLQSDGSFLVFSATNPADFWGYLRTDSSGRLFWQNEGHESLRWESEAPLVKYSDEPTLMESAFSPNAFSLDGLVHRQEWFPLTTAQKRHLLKSLSEETIAPFLQRCFAATQGFQQADKAAVGQECWKIWPYIEQIFMDRIKGVHATDRVLAIHYARTLLAQNTWTFTSSQGQTQTRSQLDWIQESLNRLVEAGGSTPNLQNGIHAFLWLKPVDPNQSKHTYKVSASLKGITWLIGGYFRGEITIKNPSWPEQTFKIVLKGFQVQLSDSISFEGTAETSNEWSPADFPGPVDLLAASAGVKAPGVKATAGGAVLTIFGSGIHTPMIVTSEEAEVGANFSKKWGIDGPDLSGRWGEIRSKDLPDVRGQKVHVGTDHAGFYGLESDAHFCLGSALLTEDARQALRIMCANEVRAFMNTQSDLQIFGYADTVGYKNATAEEASERNGRLSLLRAENTLQAIRDILGDRFKIPDKNIRKSGEGQKDAEKAGLTPGQGDPRFRRVDVFLNSALVISLRV